MPDPRKNGWITPIMGDNLTVMRNELPERLAHLCILDPPFNSKQEYSMIMPGCTAQELAFSDTWGKTEASFKAWVREKELLVGKYGSVVSFIDSLESKASRSYLSSVTPRFLVSWECLDKQGVLVIHCDDTMSHYIKVVCDGLFGHKAYLNEVVWRRSYGKVASRKWPRNTDRLLIYVKGKDYTFNPVYAPYTQEHIDSVFTLRDESGLGPYKLTDLLGSGDSLSDAPTSQPWRGYDPRKVGRGRCWSVPHWLKALYTKQTGLPYPQSVTEGLDALYDLGLIVTEGKKSSRHPMYKQYLRLSPGRQIGDLWDDIPAVKTNRSERNPNAEWVGYPTQKPLALVSRIIEVFTNPGDLVLDPYAGSGTTLVAAYKLCRRSIGIEVSPRGYTEILRRITKECGEGAFDTYSSQPTTTEGFYQLAAIDKHLAEKVACNLLGAAHSGKESADNGIDGYVTYTGMADGASHRGLVQVKTGESVTPASLANTVATFRDSRNGFDICVIVLRASAKTEGLASWAASFGYYQDAFGRQFPVMQLITIEDLYAYDFGNIRVPQFIPTSNKMSFRKDILTQQKSYQDMLDLDDGSDLPPL